MRSLEEPRAATLLRRTAGLLLLCAAVAAFFAAAKSHQPVFWFAAITSAMLLVAAIPTLSYNRLWSIGCVALGLGSACRAAIAYRPVVPHIPQVELGFVAFEVAGLGLLAAGLMARLRKQNARKDVPV